MGKDDGQTSTQLLTASSRKWLWVSHPAATLHTQQPSGGSWRGLINTTMPLSWGWLILALCQQKGDSSYAHRVPGSRPHCGATHITPGTACSTCGLQGLCGCSEMSGSGVKSSHPRVTGSGKPKARSGLQFDFRIAKDTGEKTQLCS